MIVIGAGRVGGGLKGLDPDLRLIDRVSGWEALDAPAGEPILVAVRNDDIAAVLDKVPAHRRADLVFTQNGMLGDYLDGVGLGSATRGLFFFAVAKRGDRPAPGGTSPFCGPHASAVVEWMRGVDLPAASLAADDFAAIELEKLVWNCAFGLLCEAFACDVGSVVSKHAETLRALAAEMHAVGQVSLQVEVEFEPFLARLSAYSRSIPGYRGAVKEWPWRNGWFVSAASRVGIAMPQHKDLLAEVGR